MNRILLLIGIAIGLSLQWFATATFLETGESELVACVISGLLVGFCLTLILRRGRKS